MWLFGLLNSSRRIERRLSCLLPPASCLLLLFLLLPLAGCRRGAEPGTLVVAIEAPPAGFDPRFEESPDHQTFTFHLRQGVIFHNGKPLTSADVKYTFASIKDPATRSPIRGSVDKVTTIEVPDAQTVIFRASEPFDLIGSLPAIGIIPEGAGTEQAAAPVGSGPYRFVSYNEGDAIHLEANPNYWDGAPSIPRVRVKVVTDNSTRQAELMSGEVDLALNAQFDPETVRALQHRSDIQVVIGDGANIGYLGANTTSSSLLGNVKVRQAVAYA